MTTRFTTNRLLPNSTLEFAQHRDCCINAIADTAPTLAHQWLYCADVLTTIRQHLSCLSQDNPGVISVAAAGSFGRMEAANVSDLDLLIIVDNRLDDDTESALLCIEKVWSRLEPLNLSPPEAGGIFMQPVTARSLCDPAARGNLDYPRHVFGQRMQLLLDAQPVFGDSAYQDLLTALLDWYAAPVASHPLWHQAQLLTHDLIRYYRSYNVLHQFDQRFDDKDSWYLRQLKMHHCRTLSYLGLLTAGVGELFEPGGARLLALTPVERIATLLFDGETSALQEALSRYDQLHQSLINPEHRELLINRSPEAQTDARRLFDTLMLECGEFRALLHRAYSLYQRRLPEQVQTMLTL